MTAVEDRLRDALRGRAWELPQPPAPVAQLRRAAHHRRMVRSGMALTGAAVAAAVALPLSLVNGSTPTTEGQQRITMPTLTPSTSPLSPSASASPAAMLRPTDPLPPVDDPQFPAAVFPAPATTAHGNYPACPSLTGTDPVAPPLDKASYVDIVTDFGHPSYANDLRRADRSLWPEIRRADRQPGADAPVTAVPVSKWQSLRIIPAAQDVYRQVAQHYCGQALLDRSAALVLGPDQSPALQSDVYVLRRAGHLLLWGLTPNQYASGSFVPAATQQ